MPFGAFTAGRKGLDPGLVEGICRGMSQIFPNECDPDSFYRQMYNEDLLDMYFERSRRRF